MKELNMDFMEEMLFKYIDEFKMVLFPEQWFNIFLECSKNEILALLLIYKEQMVNMSEVAEYINAPLNTATGVISRLEKRKLVERTRDCQDKRVVKISLTNEGRIYFNQEKKLLMKYFIALMGQLSGEEKQALASVMDKVIKLFKEGIPEESTEKKPSKIRRIHIE
ncbi:MAG: MarR family transcriptional regulator [Cellulosilyticum sp.]|nr:MarR family transcriptional regulator [Cellulosilyticum sp.]MEE1072135.1 MarR family transcriptional regulator [Cellulosilyticum sp.]